MCNKPKVVWFIDLGKKSPTYRVIKGWLESTKENTRIIIDNSLPIAQRREDVEKLIQNNDTSILIWETWSWKTTITPLILLNMIDWDSKIAITQPRRLATTSVSQFVANSCNSKIWDKVGYQVRFEDMTSVGTQTNFMTDGILLKYLQEDPLLNQFDIIMIDEAHERSLNIDIILWLLKRTQKLRKEKWLKDLKIIVASATIEKEKFIKYFDDAWCLEVPWRLYDVKNHFLEYDLWSMEHYFEKAAEVTKDIHIKKNTGDILIFMPWEFEINKTIEEIEKKNLKWVEILPLFWNMSPDDQNKIFAKNSNRKIIISTNIAETSLTIPWVKYVIDSWLIKVKKYHPNSWVESLDIIEHSQSWCNQRTWRGWRMESWECFRLFTEENYNKRPVFSSPEIERLNLEHTILQMKKIWINDINNFDFIDFPGATKITSAIENLEDIWALNKNWEITEIWKKLVDFPLEPKIARLILESENYWCTEQICTIAAFLWNKTVFVRPKWEESIADSKHQLFKNHDSDFMTFIKVWEEYEKNNRSWKWARDNYLNAKVLAEIVEIKQQLFQILERKWLKLENHWWNEENIGKIITTIFINNLVSWGYRIGKKWWLCKKHNASSVYNSTYVTANITRTNTGEFARICQAVKNSWLLELFPDLFESSSKIERDRAYNIVKKNDLIYKDSDRIVTSEYVEATNLEKRWFSFIQEDSYDVFSLIKLRAKNNTIMNELDRLYKLSFWKLWAKLWTIVEENDLDKLFKIFETCETTKDFFDKMLIDSSKYISKEEENKINQKYPKDFKTNSGGAIPISYNFSDSGITAEISMISWWIYFEWLIFENDEIPKLPNGQIITISWFINWKDIFISSNEDFLAIRKKILANRQNNVTLELLDSRWEMWKRNNYVMSKLSQITKRTWWKYAWSDKEIETIVKLKIEEWILREWLKYNTFLTINDFIDIDTQQLIEYEYPNNIKINGKTYDINYTDKWINGFEAYINISSFDEIWHLSLLPRVPSWLILKVILEKKWEKKIIIWTDEEFVNLKNNYLEKRWEEFKKNNPSSKIDKLESNIVYELPAIPEKLEFEPGLFVYPYLNIEITKGWNYLYWFEYTSNSKNAEIEIFKGIVVIKKERWKHASIDSKNLYLKSITNKIEEIKEIIELLRDEWDFDEIEKIENKVKIIQSYAEFNPQEAYDDLCKVL